MVCIISFLYGRTHSGNIKIPAFVLSEHEAVEVAFASTNGLTSYEIFSQDP